MTTMPSLRELQQAFLNDCLHPPGGSPAIADVIAPSAISAAGRMEIYHHSTLGNVESAMSLTYPVIQSLVGEQFFSFLIRQFTQQIMPSSPDIDEYGGELAAFLEQFEPAQSLAYLPDTARLEWLHQQIYLAPRAQIIDAQALSAVPQEEYFSLYLHLSPSVRFFSSPHPVDRIWLFNQPDTPDDMTLNLDEEEGGHFMISRPYYKISIERLIQPEKVFLEQFGEGNNLYNAYESATAIDESFDLAHYLQKHIAAGTFSGFHIGT